MEIVVVRRRTMGTEVVRKTMRVAVVVGSERRRGN